MSAPPAQDLGDLDLEALLKVEVVYGASKYEQRISQAPSSVTIISAEEIARYGYRTLADVLRSVRGFYVNYDRNYTYVGSRGFQRAGDYNSRLLLLLDGHRLNDNVYDAAYFGTEALPELDLIERIEIIRGPASSIYGTSAVFGVINLITRSTDDMNGVRAHASVGGGDSYSGGGTVGARTRGGWQLLASGSRFYSRGRDLYFAEFDDPSTNNGIASRLDDDAGARGFLSARRGPWTFQTGYVERTKGIPTAAWGTIFNDPRSRTTDRRSYVDLRFERSWKETGMVSARIYQDRVWYSGTYEVDYPPPTQNLDFAEGEWWGLEAQVAAPVGKDVRALAGIDFRDNYEQSQGAWDLDPRYEYFRDRHSLDSWAAFGQVEARPSRLVTLSAGLRHDQDDSYGGSTNPRLGAIYSAAERTTIKLLYGRAFRRPNNYELFYEGLGQKQSTSLVPERISTYEASVEQRVGDHFRAVGSAFRYDITDIVEFSLDEADTLFRFQNRGHARTNGLEVELEGRSRRGAMGRASYAYQLARDHETGAELPVYPRHLAKANLSWPLSAPSLLLSLEAQFVGAQRSLGGRRTGDYLVTNLVLLVRRFAFAEATAGVYNALDRRYGNPGGDEHVQDRIQQDGRTARVELRFRL